MPKRFEWPLPKRRRCLQQACTQHMICIIFMPLTFSHTPEKNIKNETLLIQEVNFPGQAFPYGKDNGTRPEPVQWRRAQGVSHFLFQWVPNILVKFFYSSPSKFLFYSPLQILINFLQISKQWAQSRNTGTKARTYGCLLYTSDAADDWLVV